MSKVKGHLYDQEELQRWKKLFQNFDEDFALLIEAGFMAIYQLDEDSATKLFISAQLLRPKDIMPHIGFGYIELHALELDKVKERMSWLLTKYGDNYIVKTLLGLAYIIEQGDNVEEGHKLLENSYQNSNDNVIQKMASFMHQWSQKKEKEKADSLDPIEMMANESAKNKHI